MAKSTPSPKNITRKTIDNVLYSPTAIMAYADVQIIPQINNKKMATIIFAERTPYTRTMASKTMAIHPVSCTPVMAASISSCDNAISPVIATVTSGGKFRDSIMDLISAMTVALGSASSKSSACAFKKIIRRMSPFDLKNSSVQ